jgi:hypothetical protein
MSVDNHLRLYGDFCNSTDKLDEIKAYHQEIEDLLTAEKKKFEDINIELSENEALYNKKYHFEYTLIQNLRMSVIVSLVTFLEIELQTICSALKKGLSLPLSYSEIKGTTLEQFKTYINKVVLLNFDFSKFDISSVKEVIELRNCIVHYDNQIEDFYGRRFSRSQSITSLAKKLQSIEISDNESIRLNSQACTDCIKIIEDFIVSIYHQLLDKFPKSK